MPGGLTIPIWNALYDHTDTIRPVVVAGGGVRLSGAHAELERLADLVVAAPVATTANGKSAVAETAVGVFGNFGTPLANAVVGAADVVLVVGSKLSPSDTANEHPRLDRSFPPVGHPVAHPQERPSRPLPSIRVTAT